jgi:hypothetical protein
VPLLLLLLLLLLPLCGFLVDLHASLMLLFPLPV